MRASRWMCVFAAVLIGFSLATAGAKAQGRGHDDDEKGHGHGKGHNKERKEERKEERQERKVQYRYSQHDHDEMRGWYSDHENNLPPGLAKRDRLPPGLERQLRVRGTLPPGLRDRLQPVPEDFVQRLPPPPPECEHAVIGGSIVLINRRTFVVLDIFHLGH